ncbi:MAG: hypothetical protein Q7S39_12290 [Ignavibacteria bacterium]|nr:hypothetical protein [Ignavibacteria bacterium]
MSDSNKENSLQNRIEYYQNKIETNFQKYPTDFKEFIKDEEIIRQGDDLIKNYRSTGYNFASIEDFPFLSNEPTIFYSNYIQRIAHFAELLATMENEGIITEDDVTFGARATKVNGKWDDPEPKVDMLISSKGGEITTTEFVEGVIIFTPKSNDLETLVRKIREIAEFIETRATKEAEFSVQIRDSWEVPDHRIKPVSLFVFLERINIKQAVANFLRFDNGNLIALKQKSIFNGTGWQNSPILVNSKLFNYLSEDEVLP